MKTNEPYSKRPDICYKDVGSTLFIGAVTPLSQLTLTAPLKGSLFILHRPEPPLEGRWHGASRDGEV